MYTANAFSDAGGIAAINARIRAAQSVLGTTRTQDDDVYQAFYSRNYRYGSGLPCLSAGTWAMMGRVRTTPHAYHKDELMSRHRFCRCNRCDVCRFFVDVQAMPSDVWRRYHPSPERPEFWSPESALAEWEAGMREGMGTRSIAGAFEDAAGNLLVGRAAHERISSGHTKAERLAEISRAVSVAVQRACPDIPAERAAAVLMGRIIGREEVRRGKRGKAFRKWAPIPHGELAEANGLTVAQVRRVARNGMRALRVEMAARGLVPEDHDDKRGMAAEIAARRRELGNG